MILTLILKNLKIILRSPFTIILLILTPIFLMLIVGFTYSGESLNNVKIGMINYNDDFFEFRDIEFVKYNSENIDISRKDCINDLIKSEIEMCVYFSPVKDKNGDIVSANVYYYVDNTRPKISDILIRIFDDAIKYKTSQLSKKTVTDIFGEIKETVNFMTESKKLVDELENNLTYARKNIEIVNDLYDVYIIDYNKQYNFLKNMHSSLDSQLSDLISQKDFFRANLNAFENNLDNIDDDFSSNIKSIDTVISQIDNYGAINPEIYSYISKNNLVSVKNSLKSIDSSLNYIKTDVNDLSNNLEKLDNLNSIRNSLNSFFEKTDEINNDINDLGSQIDDFETLLKEKEQEVKVINAEIGDRLSYFEELSNRDANKITEPIVRQREDLFTNFKMVHQLAPTVVILVVLFIGLLLSNVIVSLEINSKAYFRNLLSPVSQWHFILGLFMTSLIIILFQIFFLFVIMYFSFGIKNIFVNLFPLLLIISYILIIFILLGIFLSYMFESIQVSILVTTFVMLFLFLLSGIIVPIEIMPKSVANIVNYNPVVIGEDLVRQLFFFDFFSISSSMILMICLYIFVLILLIKFASNRRKKRLF